MSDVVDINKLAEEVMKCKLNAWNKIDELVHHIDSEAARVDELEATIADIKTSLSKHEIQRTSFNNEMRKEMHDLKSMVKQNDERNMKKYDEIVVSINRLIDTMEKVQHETDDNSKALMQKRIEEEKQRAINEALEEHNKPFQEYKKKAILVVVTMVTGAVVTGLWKLTVFVTNLDNMIVGG